MDFLFALLSIFVPVQSVFPLPSMCAGWMTGSEYNSMMSSAISTQTEIYMGYDDLELAKYPLRNLFYGSAGFDYMQSLNHPVFGKGHFCQDAYGSYIPIFCFNKMSKCVQLGKGDYSFVVNQTKICQ